MADPAPLELAAVEMHTAGEPVRIVTEGYPGLRGDTVLAQRRDAIARFDHLRTALMLEPRGHAGMYGVIPVRPGDPRAALAVLFMHNSGYSTMCGHATIALGRWAVDRALVARRSPVTRFVLECPCGPVDVWVDVAADGTVGDVAFDSVPAFVAARDVAVDVPGHGHVVLDISYGGAFYAIVPAARLGLAFGVAPLAAFVAAGVAVTGAARAALTVTHPTEPDLSFLYGTIITDDADPPAGPLPGTTRNVCVFADGQVDRSPTGSGATARLALDFARGRIGLGERRAFLGPTGLPFHGEVASALEWAGRPAITARIAGRAWYSGTSRFRLDLDDPLRHGFDLGGI